MALPSWRMAPVAPERNADGRTVVWLRNADEHRRERARANADAAPRPGIPRTPSEARESIGDPMLARASARRLKRTTS